MGLQGEIPAPAPAGHSIMGAQLDQLQPVARLKREPKTSMDGWLFGPDGEGRTAQGKVKRDTSQTESRYSKIQHLRALPSRLGALSEPSLVSEAKKKGLAQCAGTMLPCLTSRPSRAVRRTAGQRACRTHSCEPKYPRPQKVRQCTRQTN